MSFTRTDDEASRESTASVSRNDILDNSPLPTMPSTHRNSAQNLLSDTQSEVGGGYPCSERLWQLAQPPKRVFIDLYAMYNRVMSDERVARIKQQLDRIQMMEPKKLPTVDELLSAEIEQKRQRVRLQRRQAMHKINMNIIGARLEEKMRVTFLNRLADKLITSLSYSILCENDNYKPTMELLSPYRKALIDVALETLKDAGGVTASSSIGHDECDDLHKMIAIKVANFIEIVLLKMPHRQSDDSIAASTETDQSDAASNDLRTLVMPDENQNQNQHSNQHQNQNQPIESNEGDGVVSSLPQSEPEYPAESMTDAHTENTDAEVLLQE